MKRLILSIIFLILFAFPIYSQNIKVYGIASKGGKVIRTSVQVQNTVMETYPSCTITVYQTGTLTLASIFSDEIGTIKSNPFTANLDASWFFYIASGRYDIKFSGTGIITPFTVSDVFVNATSGGGGGTVTSVFGRTGDVVYQIGDVPFTGLNFSGSNFNSITTRSASDLNAGTLPDATFPATLPSISGVNLTNLNAANITSGTLNDARLSTNVPLKNTTNTFTQNNIFSSSVGVNTSTPRRRLDVLDGSNAQIRLSAVDNSVYTDLFVDSGGSLNVLPTGNVAFNSVGKQVNPLNNFDQNLGQINKKWLSLHAAELFVETLVAQNTIATIGGRIIVAPSNVLITDLAPSTTIIQVKYNNLASGDRVYMEGNNSVEFMAITSGASVISGGFSYSVTRNLDGTGANQWFAGDALVNTGVAGNGFIDLYSTRGVKASTQLGPTIVGNVRNSSTYNDWGETWAIGNLNGIYGYGSDTYGAAFGKYAAGIPHITVDSVLGFRIYHGLSTVRASWGTSGDLIIGTEASNQSNLFITNTGRLSIRNNTTERIRLDTDGSGFLANNLISWDASGNLTIQDATLKVNAISGVSLQLDTAGLTLTGNNGTSSSYLTWKDATGNTIAQTVAEDGINNGIFTLSVFGPDSGTDNAQLGFHVQSAVSGSGAVDITARSAGISYINFTGNTSFRGIKLTTDGSVIAPILDSAFDMSTASGAFIPTKMSSTARDALTPTDGMVIYNITTNKLQVRAAGAWVDLH